MEPAREGQGSGELLAILNTLESAIAAYMHLSKWKLDLLDGLLLE